MMKRTKRFNLVVHLLCLILLQLLLPSSVLCEFLSYELSCLWWPLRHMDSYRNQWVMHEEEDILAKVVGVVLSLGRLVRATWVNPFQDAQLPRR